MSAEFDELLDLCGEVTVEEARQIASRFNASHWKSSRPTDGEVARYSIPADPKRDDDLRLLAFIRSVDRIQRRLTAAEAVVMAANAAASCTCGAAECHALAQFRAARATYESIVREQGE